MVEKDSDNAKRSDIKALHARIKDLEDRMKEELGRKKDRDVADLKLAEIQKQIDHPHPCIQEVAIATLSQSVGSIEGGISEIKTSLNRWKSFKLGGVIALILALVSGAAYMVRAASKTETVEKSVQNIETDVSQLKTSNKRMEVRLVEMKSESKTDSREDMIEIRKMLREELEDIKLPKTKKRGR